MKFKRFLCVGAGHNEQYSIGIIHVILNKVKKLYFNNPMDSDVTKIELAKALKTIKAVSTFEQWEATKKLYVQTSEEVAIMSSVNGLTEEDEFALLTKLLGTANHIIGFEQRPLIEGNYVVADYFLNMQPGCSVFGKSRNQFPEYKCVVDVKSTEKDKFNIGGSKLRKLRNFADLLNFPLFFAVRFLRFKNHAIWAIVQDSDRTSSTLKVNYEDVVNGVRQVFWDEYSLMLSPNIMVIAKYSKSSQLNLVYHKDFGVQIELIFMSGNKELLVMKDNEASITSAILEAYNLEEVQVHKINEDITIQVLRPSIEFAFLADVIFRANSLPVDEFGRVVYDASSLIARSDTNAHNTLIDRKALEVIISPLVKNGILTFGIIGNHLEKWKSLGGQE